MTAAKKPSTAPSHRPDDLKSIAIEALLSVAQDADAPAAARAAAARTMLETIGAIGRNQDTSKLDAARPLSEMSAAEIGEEIARLSTKLPKPKGFKKIDLG